MSLIDQMRANALAPERYDGPIPLTVPAIRADGRQFVGGNRVFQEILNVLISGDRKKVKGIEEDYVDLADAIFYIGDDIIIQPDSPFLTGIRGVVRTQDGLYVAVDAAAVQSAIDEGKTGEFKVSETETVEYTQRGKAQKEQVSDVVLFPYDGIVMDFTSSQLDAITGKVHRAKRTDITSGKDFTQDEMIKDGEVMQFPWNVYPASIIVPLMEGGVNQENQPFDGIFAYNKTEHNCNTNAGFFPASAPSGNNTEMRDLVVKLRGGSGLFGNDGLGNSYGRLVGVGDKDQGAARYIHSPLEELAGKGTDVGNGIVVIRQDQISPRAYELMTQKR